MSDRRKEIFKEFLENKGTEGIEYLVGEIYFSDRRGYYVTVQPWTEREPDASGFSTRSTILLSGESQLIEGAPRFNAKRLATIQAAPAVVEALKDKVRSKWAADKAKRELEKTGYRKDVE